MPYKFAIVALMADTLSLIDVAAMKDTMYPTTDGMLRIVADGMWTIMIMFVALMKLYALSCEKGACGVPLNHQCFVTCAFFLLYFVSLWFKHYSIHLVGERRDKVGMRGELMICDFAKNRFVDRVIHISTHIWCLVNYYGCFK